MDAIIYRKAVGNGKAPKVTKAQAARIDQELELLARVRRPSLEAFIRSGEFYSLPALSPKCIDNRGHRILDHGADGWTIPADSLGRKGTADRSTAQSIILWVKSNLDAYVDTDALSIVVQ